MKEKIIYSQRIAIYLRQKGFKIIRTEVNHRYPQYDVYFFDCTPELLAAIEEYQK